MWQFNDMGAMLWHHSEFYLFYYSIFLFMCFQIDEFILFFMPVFLTSWFPPCAPGACAAVRITWLAFAKKHHPGHFSSQSFYFSLSGYSVISVIGFTKMHRLPPLLPPKACPKKQNKLHLPVQNNGPMIGVIGLT
jgi:hypothetical protein